MISSGDMVIWPETEEYAWGTEIAEWALLSPYSEDPSPLIVLLCTVCFHTGCGGVESVLLKGSQWMALCQTWVTFFFASGFLQIISFENLAVIVSEGVGLQNGDFLPSQVLGWLQNVLLFYFWSWLYGSNNVKSHKGVWLEISIFLHFNTQNHFLLNYHYGLVTKTCPTLVTPWTVASQATLPMGFSRQEYWSGLLFPSPGNLPNPGLKPGSPALQADSLPIELRGKPWSGSQPWLKWPFFPGHKSCSKNGSFSDLYRALGFEYLNFCDFFLYLFF